jgi:pimeloyl-ACP methyl ester carboxylesterase
VARQWTALARLLALRGHQVIVPDLPGYGRSIGFELSNYRLEQQVQSLHTFVRELGIDQLARNSAMLLSTKRRSHLTSHEQP